MVRRTAEVKGVEFRFESTARQSDVMGDPLRIRQVLLNLASNAIKFTDSGSVTLALAPVDDAATQPSWFRFSVADTGSGMDADTLENVFKPFQQASASTQRMHGGTGLGRSIVSELVERMGGRLEATSEQGRGSTFSVELPFDAQPDVAVVPKSLAGSPGAAGAQEIRIDWSQIRVLAADDNAVNRRVLGRMLQRIGASCTVVADGAEALAAFAEEPFDVVLLDCQMPNMDGYEAAGAIRALEGGVGAGVPIIALSGSAGELIDDVASEAGMDACLLKPIDQASLVDALLRHLTSNAPRAVLGVETVPR